MNTFTIPAIRPIERIRPIMLGNLLVVNKSSRVFETCSDYRLGADVNITSMKFSFFGIISVRLTRSNPGTFGSDVRSFIQIAQSESFDILTG